MERVGRIFSTYNGIQFSKKKRGIRFLMSLFFWRPDRANEWSAFDALGLRVRNEPFGSWRYDFIISVEHCQELKKQCTNFRTLHRFLPFGPGAFPLLKGGTGKGIRKTFRTGKLYRCSVSDFRLWGSYPLWIFFWFLFFAMARRRLHKNQDCPPCGGELDFLAAPMAEDWGEPRNRGLTQEKRSGGSRKKSKA